MGDKGGYKNWGFLDGEKIQKRDYKRKGEERFTWGTTSFSSKRKMGHGLSLGNKKAACYVTSGE